jgi:glycosyltransferase involved in cell wall biosynthesis
MRILYLCADHGIPIFGRRGCSTHVRETCLALSEAGHEVTLLCSLIGDNRHGTLRMPASSGPGSLEIIETPPNRSKKMGYDLRNLWHNVSFSQKAATLAQQRGVEAIYERFSLYSVAGVRLAHRLCLPHIVEINAFLSVEQHKKLHFPWLARWTEHYIARRAQGIVVVSDPLREALIKMKVRDERIVNMPIAVDIRHFQPNAERGLEVRGRMGLGNRLVIGYVGGLAEWHGISLLYNVARMLREYKKDFVFLLVGGEKHEVEANRQKAVQAGLQDHLWFVGSVPYPEISGYVNAMDAAIVPDTHYWTTPTKLFEYQASGIPAIAPRYAAIQKVMDDGREGFFFEPRDLNDMVRALIRIADQSAKERHDMGERARSRVVASHSWEHNIQRVLDMFENIRAGKLPGACAS